MAASKTNMKNGIKQAMIDQYEGEMSAAQIASVDSIAGAIADEVAQFVDDYVKGSGVTHVLTGYNGFVIQGEITLDGTSIN